MLHRMSGGREYPNWESYTADPHRCWPANACPWCDGGPCHYYRVPEVAP